MKSSFTVCCAVVCCAFAWCLVPWSRMASGFTACCLQGWGSSSTGRGACMGQAIMRSASAGPSLLSTGLEEAVPAHSKLTPAKGNGTTLVAVEHPQAGLAAMFSIPKIPGDLERERDGRLTVVSPVPEEVEPEEANACATGQAAA